MNRTEHTRGVSRMGPVRERARRRPLGLAALALAALALPAVGRGDEPELPDSSSFGRETVVRDTVPASREPFRAGESLRFSVQYGFIHAGTAWLEVPEVAEWNGHRAWRLVARAESNGFFDRVYRVRNRIESLWDLDERFSWRYLE